MALLLPLALVTAVVIASIFIYNNLVRARNRTQEAWWESLCSSSGDPA